MKTISVRELQKRIRYCVRASQKDKVIITRRGTPTALIIGVEGSDWETLFLQTNPHFWKMIEKRRRDKTISSATLRKRLGI